LSNRLVVGAVAAEALALSAFVYLPPLQRALGHSPLKATQWLLILVTPWVLLGAEEFRKAIVRARRKATGSTSEKQ
jgi:Ca2+-transporting ATPase